VHPAEDDGRRHHEPSARHNPFAASNLVGLLDLVEDPAYALEIGVTGIREVERAGRSLEQPHTQALLKALDKTRHG
jgi:hypothetical protein